MSANSNVEELEATIKPIEKELNELQFKIKNLEHIEGITQQAQQLKKKLAWSLVYSVDQELEDQSAKITKFKDRIPKCQAKIDWELVRNCWQHSKFLATNSSYHSLYMLILSCLNSALTGSL